MRIVYNQIGKDVLTYHANTDATFSPNTFAVAQTAFYTETVSAVNIHRLAWTGDWTITRGSNVVFVANSSGAGCLDLFQMGMPITLDNTANVVITQGTNLGSLYVQWRKISNVTGDEFNQ